MDREKFFKSSGVREVCAFGFCAWLLLPRTNAEPSENQPPGSGRGMVKQATGTGLLQWGTVSLRAYSDARYGWQVVEGMVLRRRCKGNLWKFDLLHVRQKLSRPEGFWSGTRIFTLNSIAGSSGAGSGNGGASSGPGRRADAAPCWLAERLSCPDDVLVWTSFIPRRVSPAPVPRGTALADPAPRLWRPSNALFSHGRSRGFFPEIEASATAIA